MAQKHPSRYRWLAAAGLLLVAIDLPAQTVFQCIDDDDRIAFQQQACPAGTAERRIVIAPAPATNPTAAAIEPRAPGTRRAPVARQRQPRATATAMSFRCTSASGAVFFRHSRCPKSIARAGSASATAAAGKADAVSAVKIPRRDACRQIGAFGRTGREHDESVSTYERNAGRDPCRRH